MVKLFFDLRLLKRPAIVADAELPVTLIPHEPIAPVPFG
jgi:hypothetical protein